MDFTWPDEIDQLCDALEMFIDREVRPVEEKYHHHLVRHGIDAELYEVCRGIQAKSVEAGFYALGMPESIGGGSLGELGMCRVRETVAGSGTFLSLLMMGDLPFGPNHMLLELGTEQQHEEYLHPLMRGEKTTCIALSEPDAGSDLGGVKTQAERVEGGWKLTGTKHFITNGAYCDFAQVFARSEHGHSILLVDVDSPGFTVGPVQYSMGDDHLQTVVYLDECFVPEENLVGDEGMAFAYAARFLSNERIAIASTAIGCAQYLVDEMIEHAKTRVQFGQPIGANQAIQWMVSDSLTEVYAARSMCYDTAWHADNGDPQGDLMQRVSMTKLYATEMVGRVADRAVQVFGGMGYMKEGPVERLYRMVRVMRIAGGSSEIQRMVTARLAGLGA